MSELTIVPTPMKANSMLVQKAPCPSCSCPIRGSRVCHGPMITSAESNSRMNNTRILRVSEADEAEALEDVAQHHAEGGRACQRSLSCRRR